MYVKYLAEGLAKRGHEVHILYSPGAYRLVRGKEPISESETTLKEVFVHPHLSRFQRTEVLASLSLGTWKRAGKTLGKLAAAVNPDVVHWHNTKGFIARPVKLGREISLYTAHDYYLVCPRSNLVRPNMTACENPRFCQLCLLRWGKPPELWRALGLRVLNLPSDTVVITPSEFVASRLLRDRIRAAHVLRNFVPDPTQGDPLDFVPKRDLVMYLGMLESHKGPKRLLDAFTRSMPNHGFNLAIVGNGSMRDDLVSEIRQKRLQDRITVHGFLPRPDVVRLLREASILVVPSDWHENAPLVILEAFACGTPVLGSDLGGLPEVLTRQSGSLTYKGRDTEDLARKITNLWDIRTTLPELGKKARECYEHTYSPKAHIDAYLELIKKCSREETVV